MDVIMPQLGESVDEGTISAWHKKPGDAVSPEDVLLEVETDKAAMEVPALTRGTLREILVSEGETAKVGTTIAILDPEGQEWDGGSKPSGSKSGKAAASGENDTDTAERPAEPDAAGARADSNGESGKPGKSSRLPKTAPDGTPLSPAVRRLIAQHELDPADIRGTGRDGRIQRSDVLGYLDSGQADAAAASAPDQARAPLTADDAEERVPFSSMRKRIAQNMRASKSRSAHVLQAVEVDFSAVEAVRSVFREAWKECHGGSLTYLPFIARAVCLALPDFPHLNARQDDEGLIVSKAVNLGIAVNLDFEGLVVPVIRGAEQLKVPELARRAAELAERARANRLTPDDMSGATYTISNNGSYGTLITAPIISQPQVAILSADGVSKRPWVAEDENGEDNLVVRPVGVLAQSFDHCVIDGAYSAAFLRSVKRILETRNWPSDFV